MGSVDHTFHSASHTFISWEYFKLKQTQMKHVLEYIARYFVFFSDESWSLSQHGDKSHLHSLLSLTCLTLAHGATKSCRWCRGWTHKEIRYLCFWSEFPSTNALASDHRFCSISALTEAAYSHGVQVERLFQRYISWRLRYFATPRAIATLCNWQYSAKYFQKEKQRRHLWGFMRGGSGI